MDTIEYATFRYDTVELENGLKTPFTRDRMRMVTIWSPSMTLKFVIILLNLIKAYHRKSGKSKYDRKLTELDVETTRIRSRVNGV